MSPFIIKKHRSKKGGVLHIFGGGKSSTYKKHRDEIHGRAVKANDEYS